MENNRMGEPDYKLLFESASSLYLVMDPDFRIIAVNDAYAKSLNIEKSDLLGKNVLEAFPATPSDEQRTGAANLRVSLETVVKTGQAHTMAIEKYDVLKKNNGHSFYEERYWSPHNSPIFDSQNRLIYIIHRAEDVTDLMRLSSKQRQGQTTEQMKSRVAVIEPEVFFRAQEIHETNLRLKGANEELEMREKELRALYDRLARVDRQKTQFFANVSHELRTPLTLILGHIERLLNEAKASVAMQNSLMTIKRNAQALLRHVNDLLDVAKFDAGELKPHYAELNIAQLVSQIGDSFSVLATERHFNFQIESPPSLSVQTDGEMIQRILMNLVGNAFKFTPDYGAIRCRVESVFKSQKDFFRITISDSGPGIPNHLRHSIFERFFQVQDSVTRQVGGTGLGLAIVKDFVDILRGTIEVHQSREGGAQFIAEFPVAAPPGSEVHTHEVYEGASANLLKREIQEEVNVRRADNSHVALVDGDVKKPLILVVEDNIELSKFVVEALESEYRCAVAFNGLEGYEKARELKPDLILSDLMMPKYSGEFLVEKMRHDSLCKDIPIIILTAQVDEASKIRLLGLGVQDYLFKPFVTEEVLVRVRNEVRDYRARKLLQRELEFKEDNIESLARDVTFKNQELQRLSRLKDEFLATLSHELRTPVSVIFGYAEILSEEYEDKEVMAEAIEAITRNAKIQLRLVSDLIDISKSITGKIVLEPGETNLKSILDDVLDTAESAAKAKRIQLSVQLDSSLKPLWADSVRMSQIIWNLVSNAIKFTPVDGLVKVHAIQTQGAVEISVVDSGKGIDASFLPYLFDRFRQQDGSVTRKFGGLGLGLAIVKHLVELHGGTVRAESAGLGQGATFIVTIPSYQSMASEDEKVLRGGLAASQLADLKGRSILVVDDDSDTLQVVALILKRNGMEVLTAESAADAQVILRDLIPDMLVSDIGMPEMNGYEFIRAVRESTTAVRHVPALALTAFASKDTEDKAVEAGFDVYLAKPIESKKLIQALSLLLQRRVYAKL
ncbi:Sensor histidine kinase TmoS [compost metagenome]